MSCFSPVLYASENQDSYEELKQKFSALQSLEGRKITDGNSFFKEAAKNLPNGKYVTIERPVLEHILLTEPLSALFANMSPSGLGLCMNLPFKSAYGVLCSQS